MENINVLKTTKYRKVLMVTDTLFGRQVRPVTVVDVCNGNVVLLSSEHCKSREEFMNTVRMQFPELLDQCKQRFRNDGKLDSEVPTKLKRRML